MRAEGSTSTLGQPEGDSEFLSLLSQDLQLLSLHTRFHSPKHLGICSEPGSALKPGNTASNRGKNPALLKRNPWVL